MKYLCYDSALNGEYTLIRLMQRYPQHISLFKGTDDEDIWDAAPYLFGADDDFFEMRSDKLISLQHCVIFVCPEPREELCRFLQSYIYTGENNYLRLWDARVLQRMFIQWREKERINFFEFFKGIYTEAAQENDLNEWYLDRRLQVVARQVAKATLLKEAVQMPQDEKSMKVPDNSDTVKKQEVDIPAPAEEPPKRRRFFID